MTDLQRITTGDTEAKSQNQKVRKLGKSFLGGTTRKGHAEKSWNVSVNWSINPWKSCAKFPNLVWPIINLRKMLVDWPIHVLMLHVDALDFARIGRPDISWTVNA